MRRTNGRSKQEEQSTVHTNLITVGSLWDMDCENSVCIEKHGEVKGTPTRQNGAPMMVCETYQRVIFTGKKGTDRTANVTAGRVWTGVRGGTVCRTYTQHVGGGTSWHYLSEKTHNRTGCAGRIASDTTSSSAPPARTAIFVPCIWAPS